MQSIIHFKGDEIPVMIVLWFIDKKLARVNNTIHQPVAFVCPGGRSVRDLFPFQDLRTALRAFRFLPPIIETVLLSFLGRPAHSFIAQIQK